MSREIQFRREISTLGSGNWKFIIMEPVPEHERGLSEWDKETLLMLEPVDAFRRDDKYVFFRVGDVEKLLVEYGHADLQDARQGLLSLHDQLAPRKVRWYRRFRSHRRRKR